MHGKFNLCVEIMVLKALRRTRTECFVCMCNVEIRFKDRKLK